MATSRASGALEPYLWTARDFYQQHGIEMWNFKLIKHKGSYLL